MLDTRSLAAAVAAAVASASLSACAYVLPTTARPGGANASSAPVPARAGDARTSPSPGAPPPAAHTHQPADAPVDPFITLTEDENKKFARELKAEMRAGLFAKRAMGGASLGTELEQICGTVVWDRCEVLRLPYDKLGWARFTFRVRGGDGTTYAFPDMFFDRAQAAWAKAAIDRIKRWSAPADRIPVLLSRLEAICGDSLLERCQLRGSQNGVTTYIHVVADGKLTGEAFELVETVKEWNADL